ncbi:MAG: TetR/AcrR family transcriptional regulator [Candidatus Leucobacter sulfamidivorax]|nr:TetR/AcrR family transcriptional regulator [Candidatus Leucobacter sulfamidivorax]
MLNMFSEHVQSGYGMGATREEQRRETETRVLRAAGELFRAHGFANTTIRDIAAACGVSAGTVASVGEKDALLVASFDRLIERIHEDRSRSGGSPEGSAVEQILMLLDPFVEIFAADVGLARAYGSVLVAGERDSVVFSELADALIREIEAALLRSSAHGMDAQTARPLAESIYFAYIGRLFSWPSREAVTADALRHSLRRVVEAICRSEEAEK